MTALQPGDRVTLHYRIASYGQEIANTFGDAPETFRLGDGDIEPRLEQALVGLAEGTRTTLELFPWQAFGERDETLVQTLPASDLPADFTAEVEQQIEFEMPNGETVTGTVLAVDPAGLTVDFNHPLAGLPIEFEVQILAIDHA